MAVYHDRGCPQLLQVQVLPSDYGNWRSMSVEIYTGRCRGVLVSMAGPLGEGQ